MYGHIELKATARGRQIVRISMLWSYSCMPERILEAYFKHPLQFPFSEPDSILLHFTTSSLLGLDARATPLVLVLMSTFQASFTNQGTPPMVIALVNRHSTVELNAPQSVCFTDALGELLRGLRKFFNFITRPINLWLEVHRLANIALLQF
jgi:hypothetical protein